MSASADLAAESVAKPGPCGRGTFESGALPGSAALFRCVQTNKFTATRTDAADLDHRGFAYLHVMGDICRLGIKASRRQLLEVGSVYLLSIARIPGARQDSDFA